MNKVDEVTELVNRIRNRLKQESKDYEQLVQLNKENPKLAELCEDIDNIITNWGYNVLSKIMSKNK